MTGVAKKMKAGGYKTHMVGKWDAGMATPEHSPLGKGYDTWLGYFQHANDYWQESMPLASTGNLDVCLNECHAWSKCGKFFLFFFSFCFFRFVWPHKDSRRFRSVNRFLMFPQALVLLVIFGHTSST